MSAHKDNFFNFIKALNENNVEYYFLRGFSKLPDKPDTDVDLVYNHEQIKIYRKIAGQHLTLEANEDQNYGFAEYADMLYTAYFTPGPHDDDIPNGRFRVDSYNCLHMLSPSQNFQSRWTMPIKFNRYVSETRVKVEYEVPYYIPSPECEIILLVLRDCLDLQGSWKQKHIDRVNLLMEDYNKEELIKCASMVLPRPEETVSLIKMGRHPEIYNSIVR
jgi:hypothetical protein